MTGGANQFDTSFVGGMIRLCSRKCRQKGMVDIDDPVGELVHKLFCKDLVILRQDHQIDFFFFKHGDLFSFHVALIFLTHIKMTERDLELLGQVLGILMVADDDGDLAG